ncbi:MAG: undecaprenyl diphosphate synthase family protein [Gemmatimonadetes bacterium]|nr:undecaprenyl diphosphate synthase family protein [Gemmatimonadota bacterium]
MSKISDDIPNQASMLEHVGVILDLPLYWRLGLLAPDLGLWGNIRSIKALVAASSAAGIKRLTLWTMSLPRALELEYCQQRIRGAVARLCLDLDMELAVHESDQDVARVATSAACVNIYLTFDGKRQVIQALRNASSACGLPLAKRDVEAYLTTRDCSAPDLVIRTSSTKSMRGFMLWQSVGSEFWFHESFLPFSARHFHAALRSFASRQRRHGE